jgi:hypothetical protein
MQCASSMTTRPVEASSPGRRRAKPALPSRSGETSSTSSRSPAMSSKTASQSSRLVELTVAARSPACAAAATWSRISASSGETTSVGPRPAARSAEVAAQ